MAGEPLRLKMQKGLYGPYADNLNKVLETLEGHFILGYDGSRKPDKALRLVPSAPAAAEEFLSQEIEAKTRLDRVGELIEGFETPYGMELLSSVHFVAKHDDPIASTFDEVVQAIRSWNDRKRDLMNQDHIRIAWDHLRTLGWLQ